MLTSTETANKIAHDHQKPTENYCSSLDHSQKLKKDLSYGEKIGANRTQTLQAPHRKFDPSLLDENITTTKCIKFHVEKPIVRTPRPQHFNEWLSKQVPAERSASEVGRPSELDFATSLELSRKWTTTATFAMEESALPTPRQKVPETTLETRADPVSYRSYNSHHHHAPMLWQKLGRKWDQVQLRESMSNQDSEKEKLIL